MRGIPFSAGFRPFQPYEAAATTLWLFEHTLVPGLFQSEEYARAILSAHPNTSAEVPDSPDMVAYLETVDDGQTVEDPGEDARLSLRFSGLRTAALTGSGSVRLIEKVMDEWNGTD
ncbi:MAG: Scr1 family TA system antitoxin-like transcriptional regulator [Streptosporangiaceae bacterium]